MEPTGKRGLRARLRPAAAAGDVGDGPAAGAAPGGRVEQSRPGRPQGAELPESHAEPKRADSEQGGAEQGGAEQGGAEQGGALAILTRMRPGRLPVATAPRATAVVALVAVVLLAVAGYLGVSWWRTAHSASAQNSALVDVAATAQVSQQLGDAVKRVYSFDYTRLDQNEKDARDVITPEFDADFMRLFAQVRELAPQQQAVSTATVAQSAVKEVRGDRAVLVVFLDQQVTRAAPANGATQLASAGRLTVTGQLVDGRWRIADVQVL